MYAGLAKPVNDVHQRALSSGSTRRCTPGSRRCCALLRAHAAGRYRRAPPPRSVDAVSADNAQPACPPRRCRWLAFPAINPPPHWAKCNARNCGLRWRRWPREPCSGEKRVDVHEPQDRRRRRRNFHRLHRGRARARRADPQSAVDAAGSFVRCAARLAGDCAAGTAAATRTLSTACRVAPSIISRRAAAATAIRSCAAAPSTRKKCATD